MISDLLEISKVFSQLINALNQPFEYGKYGVITVIESADASLQELMIKRSSITASFELTAPKKNIFFKKYFYYQNSIFNYTITF